MRRHSLASETFQEEDESDEQEDQIVQIENHNKFYYVVVGKVPS